MTAFLLGLLPTVGPWLAGTALVVVVWVLGRFTGGRATKKAIAAAQAQAELRARNEADKIEDAIAGRSVDENRTRLKRWGR